MAKRKKRQKRIRFWKAFVFLLLAVLAGTAAFGIRRIKSGEDRPGRNAGPAVLQGAAGRLAADTQDAQAARQEMQEEREAWIRSMSHDIRTPLTSLDGYFQLLETTQEPGEQSRYIRIIQERISSLKEMLEELFLFAKLKNDSYQIDISLCCFSSILKETVFSYYDEWQRSGIEPEIQIPEERLYFMGNEQSLRRLIQNVIKNGLDHGKDRIGIRLCRKEGMLCLKINNQTDHPEKIDISRVFERFYKSDGARSRTSSGLGLSIARELAVRMGGKMEAGICEDQFWIEAEFPEVQG